MTPEQKRAHAERMLAHLASVPRRGADGRYHFLYVTWDVETLEWYGGKHSTADLADGYIGSGLWIARHLAQARLKTEPIEFFDSEDAALLAERAWLTFRVIKSDPLCRNFAEGGGGFTSAMRAAFDMTKAIATREANPNYRLSIAAAEAKRAANPNRGIDIAAGMAALSDEAKEELRNNHAAAMELRSAKSEWREATTSRNRLLVQTENWKTAQAAGIIRRSDNAEWQANVGKGLREWQQTDAARTQYAVNGRKVMERLWEEAKTKGIVVGMPKGYKFPEPRTEQWRHNISIKLMAESPSERSERAIKGWETRRANGSRKGGRPRGSKTNH